jgi:hypothetical protein
MLRGKDQFGSAYSNLPEAVGNWDHDTWSVGRLWRLFPHNMPEKKGAAINTAACVDANLCHDQNTMKLVLQDTRDDTDSNLRTGIGCSLDGSC